MGHTSSKQATVGWYQNTSYCIRLSNFIAAISFQSWQNATFHYGCWLFHQQMNSRICSISAWLVGENVANIACMAFHVQNVALLRTFKMGG